MDKSTEKLNILLLFSQILVSLLYPFRYFLEEICDYLNISSTTGDVTLAKVLSYEADPQVKCTVYAQDEYGSGNSGEATIIIDVEDVVDKPPIFTLLVGERIRLKKKKNGRV